MRTADECDTEAARLRRDAANTLDLALKGRLLSMASSWAGLAITARWQDTHPNSDTYRVP